MARKIFNSKERLHVANEEEEEEEDAGQSQANYSLNCI